MDNKKILKISLALLFSILIALNANKIDKENTQSLPNSLEEKATPTLRQKETFKVIKVIDGDTIEIEGKQKVRYIGINTPELNDDNKTIRCFAQMAFEKNKELVEGKEVKLEKDISETDKYGRLLRYVFVGDIFVNDYLVRQGFAQVATYPQMLNLKISFWKLKKKPKIIIVAYGIKKSV